MVTAPATQDFAAKLREIEELARLAEELGIKRKFREGDVQYVARAAKELETILPGGIPRTEAAEAQTSPKVRLLVKGLKKAGKVGLLAAFGIPTLW